MACRGCHAATLQRELGTGSPGFQPSLPSQRSPPASLHSPQPIPLPLGGPSLREAPLEGVKELGVVWPYLYPGGGLVPSPLPHKTWSSEDVGYTGQTEQMDKLKRGKIQVRRLHSTWALLGRRAALRVPP